MKAVLMSIQPKWCELIASGKKTIEVRKTKPKLETPFKVYIYATKQREYLHFRTKGSLCIAKPVGGKVIGEFVCDVINPIYSQSVEKQALCAIAIGNGDKEYYENSCVSYKEAYRYLKNVKMAYGWHISDLVIYDKPKELSEFRKPCDYDLGCKCCSMYFPGTIYAEPYCKNGNLEIKRPFQSWGYVNEVD